MNLPVGFQFSQGSLQDFVDCRRRFQLKYLLRLTWPALQTEPASQNEKFMRQGEFFHHLVHQHILGIPPGRLEDSIQDEEVAVWWRNYLKFSKELKPPGTGTEWFPETSLSAPLATYRLVAKYDLVLSQADGRITIFDWKTSRKQPKRIWLAEHLQTHVYPYLLVRAGEHFIHGTSIQPEYVDMVYWFTNHPDQPERFSYDGSKFREDGVFFEQLIAEIERLEQAEFPLTSQLERCAYCVYRSLCDRGVRAGPMEGRDDDLGIEEITEILIDFEQISEIEF